MSFHASIYATWKVYDLLETFEVPRKIQPQELVNIIIKNADKWKLQMLMLKYIITKKNEFIFQYFIFI